MDTSPAERITMNPTVHITLLSDRPSHQVADLTREIFNDLRHEADLSVKEVGRAAEPGERAAAEIGLLGQLALTFLTAGAGTALINCLKAYIERDSSLRFRLKRADGAEIELEGKDLDSDHLAKTLQDLEQLVS